jgi:hypothetical protein
MRVPLFGKVLVRIRGIEYVSFPIRATDVGIIQETCLLDIAARTMSLR